MVPLCQGLGDADFLLKYETAADPWERSRLVGERIRALRESFVKMTKEREELGKQGEVELKVVSDVGPRQKRHRRINRAS